MSKCLYCGTEIHYEDRRCPYCNAPVENNQGLQWGGSTVITGYTGAGSFITR